MGVETAAAVMMVGGTGLQIYSQYEEARMKSEAAKKNAAAKRDMAYDLLKRAEYNIAETEKEGDVFAAEQLGAFAKSGVAFEGSVLLALEDTAYKISQSMINQQREADAKACSLFMGADVDLQLSGDIKKVADLQAASTLLNLGSKMAMKE